LKQDDAQYCTAQCRYRLDESHSNAQFTATVYMVWRTSWTTKVRSLRKGGSGPTTRLPQGTPSPGIITRARPHTHTTPEPQHPTSQTLPPSSSAPKQPPSTSTPLYSSPSPHTSAPPSPAVFLSQLKTALRLMMLLSNTSNSSSHGYTLPSCPHLSKTGNQHTTPYYTYTA
jgi:hypothetical protein